LHCKYENLQCQTLGHKYCNNLTENSARVNNLSDLFISLYKLNTYNYEFKSSDIAYFRVIYTLKISHTLELP